MKFEATEASTGTTLFDISKTTHPFLNGISSTEDKFCAMPDLRTRARSGSGQSLAEKGGKSVLMTESVGGGFVLAVADIYMLNNHAGVYWSDNGEICT